MSETEALWLALSIAVGLIVGILLPTLRHGRSTRPTSYQRTIRIRREDIVDQPELDEEARARFRKLASESQAKLNQMYFDILTRGSR